MRLEELWVAYSDSMNDACLDDVAPDPTTAIRIGLDYDMPSILPAAFYCLSEIDIEDDWDRWHGDDWHFFEGKDVTASDPTKKWRRTARWSKISQRVLFQVLLGKKALSARAAAFPRIYRFEEADDGSKPKESCKTELNRLAETFAVGSGNPEPLQTLMGMMKTNRTNKALCNACKRTVRKNIDKEMQMLWDDLPYMFSLVNDRGEFARASIVQCYTRLTKPVQRTIATRTRHRASRPIDSYVFVSTGRSQLMHDSFISNVGHTNSSLNALIFNAFIMYRVEINVIA